MAPRARFDKDYYGVLGVAAEATDDELRRVYRRLALQWHPDRNPGRPEAEERFKEISEAYAVLIDAAKRREYDRARRSGRAADFQASREDLFRDLFSDPTASAVFDELAREFERLGVTIHRRDFQEVLFGGRAVVRGRVVVVPASPLLVAARVAQKLLGARRPARRPSRPSTRVDAAGGVLGSVARLGRRWLGLGAGSGDSVLRITRAEAERGARKRVVLRADGRDEEVMVTVPAGVRAGTRLRLRGKGRTVAGGGRGDLYLAVEIVEGW
jgi:curved DNA-binding protein CbpA